MGSGQRKFESCLFFFHYQNMYHTMNLIPGEQGEAAIIDEGGEQGEAAVNDEGGEQGEAATNAGGGGVQELCILLTSACFFKIANQRII